MKNDEKIELLKYNISRFDHYYASVNFKSSFLIIANITIIGFLFSIGKIDSEKSLLLTISALVSIGTIFFVLLAIKPYLETYKDKNSLIFYGDISNSNICELSQKLENFKEGNYIEDLTKQNYFLAKGLKFKFDMLNVATIIFIINIIIYFFAILFNK